MIYAYIDEFGTNSLEIEKEGVTSHFLLGCTLVKSENINSAKDSVIAIRDLYFQGSEIKSNKVKRKNHARRLTILQELSKIEFSFFLLVVDKSEIKTKGLTFKQSFYKYFHKILVTYLDSIHGKIQFYADALGDDTFQKSFEKYIKNSIIQTDLFNPEVKYQFIDSSDSDIIQLSDFLTGSLAKYFDIKSATDRGEEFLEVLSGKINVRYWPDNVDDYLVFNQSPEEYDKRIAELSINLAQNRIQKIQGSESEYSKAQIILLSHLLLVQKVSPSHFVQTEELKEKIRLSTGIKLSDRLFRKEIIGNLRDNNVIIASRNAGGYKLPVNKGDLIEFVNRYNSIIQPMVGRLKKSRESILVSTNNDIDILNYEQYHTLKKIIES